MATTEPAADERAQERAKLILAARVVLARGGWWGFKVESVIREAKLSTRSFYRHFEKKDELLLRMLEEDVARGAKRLHRLVNTSDDPTRRIDAYVLGVLDMAYDERIAKPTQIFSWHWHELSAEYPHEVLGCVNQLVEPLVGVLEDARQSGALPHVRPELDARAVFHLVAGITTHALSSGGQIARADAVETSLSFIHRAMAAPAVDLNERGHAHG